ncbi:hypothetical protein HYT23_00230 [Candidatus Pacearchaeota archaeon]|nr:hypothetical protein [Candidatus Pacearchaeota archaeon]
MANDNKLVDEYEKLQNLKNELDVKIEELKKEIVNLAREKNTDMLLGTSKKCSIREYIKVIYPENKTRIIELIKEKGLYEKFSSINYFKLGPAIVKGNIDYDIQNLVRKEKAFRLSLLDI